jgi:urea transporter
MTESAEKQVLAFIKGILHSYSQIFFSKNILFSVILVVVTFFDKWAGLSGLLAVIITNTLALMLGYNRWSIGEGLYGFNSLLVGLGLGIYYEPGAAYFVMLFFSAIFTFFLTIWLQNHFGKYGLPYLAWPFVAAIWIVTLAARQFTGLEISARGLYVLNDLYDSGGIVMVDLYNWFNNLPLPEPVVVYFRSLGAIFFQYQTLAGIFIVIGLIIYSRIAFLLSLLGFFSAYLFYWFIGASLSELTYSYIGFNFILTAIAVGGFFIVPSRQSFLWVVLLTPVISIIIAATNTLFNHFLLPVYSLPFNMVVVLFLYVLKFRERYFKSPEPVVVQQNSPEKNLYMQHNYHSRFDAGALLPKIHLPFHGQWVVTQAHNGQFTHREDWKHAWDFEIADEEGNLFAGSGKNVSDYYCYNQPVIAPADGIVAEIFDGVEDNIVGEMNLEKNWGNTIIIKHTENLYSKISHLKKGTFTVVKGDEVKRGMMIAKVGNSGRSPVPHLHFQLQKTPSIGSKTLDHPIAEYILHDKKVAELKTYDRPQKDQVIGNISRNDALFKAFNFIPGQTILWEFIINNGRQQKEEWEVKTDIYNNTYLECEATASKAWFKNEGNIFYFTQFSGSENSFMYYFYLGAYKVALGFQSGLMVNDNYPLAIMRNNFRRFWQDFVAPFYIYMKAKYTLKYVKMEDDLSDSSISLAAESRFTFSSKKANNLSFEVRIETGKFSAFKVTSTNFSLVAQEVDSK